MASRGTSLGHKRRGERGRIVFLRLALDPGPCVFISSQLQLTSSFSATRRHERGLRLDALPVCELSASPLVVFNPSRAKHDYVLSSVGRVGFIKQPPQGDRNHPICAGPHLVRCLFHRILFQTHLIVRKIACSVVMEIGWLLFFI